MGFECSTLISRFSPHFNPFFTVLPNQTSPFHHFSVVLFMKGIFGRHSLPVTCYHIFVLYFTFAEFLNFQFWSSRKIPKNTFSKCDIYYHSKIISKIMKTLQNEFSNFVSKYFYLVYLCALLPFKSKRTFQPSWWVNRVNIWHESGRPLHINYYLIPSCQFRNDAILLYYYYLPAGTP